MTQAKDPYGLTAPQIEQALGLRPFELRDIAFVDAPEETPGPGGFEFKLTASFPDGKVFEDPTTGLTEAMHEAIDRFRLGIGGLDRSWHPVIQFYPPGARVVPQWPLTELVALGPRLGIATRTSPFLRENGPALQAAPAKGRRLRRQGFSRPCRRAKQRHGSHAAPPPTPLCPRLTSAVPRGSAGCSISYHTAELTRPRAFGTS